jgi:RNA recognition motif 2
MLAISKLCYSGCFSHVFSMMLMFLFTVLGFTGIHRRCSWLQLMRIIEGLMILFICRLISRQVLIFIIFLVLFLLSSSFKNELEGYSFYLSFWILFFFQNKCNVGYAFINMINPQHIISFYQVCYLCTFLALMILDYMIYGCW